MSMFGWGVGDIIAIPQLALKVHSAYQDAPDNYRHISEEVDSLQIIINKAVKHFEGTTLSDIDRQEGQKVLKGCQSVLEDLNSLIEEYNSLSSVQVFKKVKLGGEDFITLRLRLISNTGLLNSFIQRFDIPTITRVFHTNTISFSAMKFNYSCLIFLVSTVQTQESRCTLLLPLLEVSAPRRLTRTFVKACIKVGLHGK